MPCMAFTPTANTTASASIVSSLLLELLTVTLHNQLMAVPLAEFLTVSMHHSSELYCIKGKSKALLHHFTGSLGGIA